MKKIKILWLLLFSLSTIFSVQSQTYNFGKKIEKNTGVIIDQKIAYSKDLGYGFDYATEKDIEINNTSFSSEKSVYFSVKVPAGNYKVEVVLGGEKKAKTTVKAEARRLMLNQIETLENETVTKTFTVTLRGTKIKGNKRGVKLKSREIGTLGWDDKLTFEFLGNLRVQSLKITPASNVVTMFLAGDSTVTDQNNEPWASWGQFITNYFTSDVTVSNYAASGLALVSFEYGNRLEKILEVIKPGDYLFVEFGHNDEKRKGKEHGAWGSYSDLLREFVTRAKEKGGIPVLVTPTQRRHFNDDGTLEETHGDFPAAMRKVAKELDVYLIDVTKMTTKAYEAWGVEYSKNALVHYPANTFPNQTKALSDNTHFNSFGANEIALCVLKGIKELNLDISKYINQNFTDYNPNKPSKIENWTVPMSTKYDLVKPDGN
ncbi:rhamnogalacturonan acetylesterase [Wenyingzhuangia sp. IMCC45467]